MATKGASVGLLRRAYLNLHKAAQGADTFHPYLRARIRYDDASHGIRGIVVIVKIIEYRHSGQAGVI